MWFGGVPDENLIFSSAKMIFLGEKIKFACDYTLDSSENSEFLDEKMVFSFVFMGYLGENIGFLGVFDVLCFL